MESMKSVLGLGMVYQGIREGVSANIECVRAGECIEY